ncbi:MAG: hypothetical protein MUC43_07895 [Pirellula sp.]|jgi:hypothetical protein|nr:hypothetical protein [Pirellula sp.]
MRITVCIAAMLSMACYAGIAEGNPVDRNAGVNQDIQALRSLEAGDESMVKGASAAARLRDASDCKLMDFLHAMKGAKPVGKNWLLGIANKRYLKEKGAVQSELGSFLADTSNDPEARYTVFSWLTEADTDLRMKLLPGFLDDPSPELRYAAVQQVLESTPEADRLKTLLSSARHPSQIVEIINRLDKAGVVIDQREHFGFLSEWKLIGPFDHVGGHNFEKAFPVEGDWQKGSRAPVYEGKAGEVKWIDHTTSHKEGLVDLASLYNKEKGCIVYGVTEFESPIAGPAEIRMGCINGNRVWVNGELVMSNEVYHSSMQIDQYIEPIVLVKGTNRILIKICQNEQKEGWAQDYQFQIRISDSTGLAITAK